MTAVPGDGNRLHSNALRVLLVEDNLINRKLATRILEKLGCLVDAAANGAEGVAMASRGIYDAVFMDCQMPVMDGYEATRRIRDQFAHHGRLPIIAVTANTLPADRRRCEDVGMDDFVAKPYTPSDLHDALLRWCRPAEGSSG